MADIATELVAVERKLWKGRAESVTAETTEGEIGVLPGHQPFLGQLVENGTVTIRTEDGKVLVAAVQGGFISVSTRKITVLADTATWADEVDVSEAERLLESDDEKVKAQAQSHLRASRRAQGVA
ncbi:F0F1 ATP synthase subunit epsilon [uncultured Corynebacterium sp.]|uniref:F0F1 ATP synthase subunit epsilon n=1 Tax=uncultured Corynebacterium sp. TaxID=159447 RepID=UPI002633BFF5|nr:F0F1 ATP synthase subunit epsilon [uncultured Corynebacterium sp.]